jgi:hypothetical protein
MPPSWTADSQRSVHRRQASQVDKACNRSYHHGEQAQRVAVRFAQDAKGFELSNAMLDMDAHRSLMVIILLLTLVQHVSHPLMGWKR